MKENSQDAAMPTIYDTNESFTDDCYDELDLRYWINSTRRFCVPTVMHVETTDGRSNRSLRSPLVVRSGEAPQSVSPAGCSDESLAIWGNTPLPPIHSQSLDVFDITQPPTPESRRIVRVKLGQRWRAHANGAIRRYAVESKVGNSCSSPNVERQHFYRTVDEIASRLAEEREERRLPHIECAPPPVVPRQFVLRATNVDPRVLAGELHMPQQRSVVGPVELQMRTALFENTLGAVRPYASDSRRRRRTRHIPPAMPASALTRDPMEVFVEMMRYQRPGLGVCSFDVH
ncbi:hypothetical protein LSM04_004968 [Trypanosoma melophagium]|uniref:uncharacterized protein n=1 Tax=Trypanosoma melophagium TaxID=715481 RepID=UPI00351A5518|nr:hypothetical protein LSM04_004968 [Trypanosoma melophagium]